MAGEPYRTVAGTVHAAVAISHPASSQDPTRRGAEVTRKRAIWRDLEWIADHQRIARQHERDREAIGPRALSAQIQEWACGTDAGDLAELLTLRMLGEEWHFVPGEEVQK
jgi:hypothetical protein